MGRCGTRGRMIRTVRVMLRVTRFFDFAENDGFVGGVRRAVALRTIPHPSRETKTQRMGHPDRWLVLCLMWLVFGLHDWLRLE